jgi:hypothetical protein
VHATHFVLDVLTEIKLAGQFLHMVFPVVFSNRPANFKEKNKRNHRNRNQK